jgi:hypothetical protein
MFIIISFIEPTIPFEGLQLAGKKDIAAMKIHAIEDRGTRRDFIDTYILAQEFTLQEMRGFYQQKFACLDTAIPLSVRCSILRMRKPTKYY